MSRIARRQGAELIQNACAVTALAFKEEIQTLRRTSGPGDVRNRRRQSSITETLAAFTARIGYS
jgi:hypothetical protein